MAAIHETAYPRLRSMIPQSTLIELYTPTQEEHEFAQANTQAPLQELGMLILLKTFQSLGYFPMLRDVPKHLIDHVASCIGLEAQVPDLKRYESVGSRTKHLPRIRAFLHVTEFGQGGSEVMNRAMQEASRSKDIIADIINAAIEELIRKRCELPSFSTLVRAANSARYQVNSGFFRRVSQSLSDEQIGTINCR